MSEIKVKTIEPSTGTNLTLGTSGDTIAVSSDSVKLDIWKDSGGNTLFQSDGSGTLSNVNSSFSGAGPKLILSQTADASSSIEFTTGIDSTYDEYVFYFVNCTGSVNNASFTFNGSSDAGSNYDVVKTTTLFTAQHNESGASSNLFYDSSRDIAQGTGFQILDYKVDGAPVGSHPGGACGDFHLFGPSSTTYVKNFYSTSQYIYYDVSSPYSTNSFCAGYFNTTSVVNAIRFQMDSGTFDGTIKMYGVT